MLHIWEFTATFITSPIHYLKLWIMEMLQIWSFTTVHSSQPQSIIGNPGSTTDTG